MGLLRKLRVGAPVALVLVLTAITGPVAAAAPTTVADPQDVVVTFTTAHAAQRVADDLASGELVSPTLLSVKATSAEVGDLEATAGVVAVEPDVAYHASALPTAPNDPCVTSASACGGIRAWQFDALGIRDLWARTHGAGVTIAVVDGGVDASVPDLEDKLAGPEIDLSDAHDGPSDHGTTVAALAAASTDNAIGSAGIAWDSRILSIKVLDTSGTGRLSTVAAGVVQATDRGARVINLSLSGQRTTALANAVQYAIDHGVIVVAAAGNDGTDAPTVTVASGAVDGGYPARYPGVIAVGASAPDGNVASFSDFGSWVDVFAPGVDLPAPVVGGTLARFSGTSAAAPLVSGVAALLASSSPSLTSPLVEAALRSSTVALTGRPGAAQLDASALAANAALFPDAPNSPVGVVDGVGRAPGGTIITGWTVDPDAAVTLDVHTYVDGRFFAVSRADAPRPDVAAALPGFGAAHGFSIALPLAKGQHTVCVYGINQGAGINALVACVPVNITGLPFGAIDGTARVGNVASLSGWVIDPGTTSAARVQLVVDSVTSPQVTADVLRPDLATVFPLFGVAHGFRIDTVVSDGPHTICVLGVPSGSGPSVGLGCRSI